MYANKVAFFMLLLLTTTYYIALKTRSVTGNKLCCHEQVKLGNKFLSSMNSGGPYHISSEHVYLTDARRAIITRFEYHEASPFGFWIASLRSSGKYVDITKELDQLDDFRDAKLIAVSGGINQPCERFIWRAPEDKTRQGNVTLKLPMGVTWKDVAWIGIYDFGYKYLLNYIWINPLPGSLSKLNICLNKPSCWTLPTDPVGCSKKLMACTDPKIDCATPENYCFRKCELHELNLNKAIPAQEAERCGVTRRNEGEIFGCEGKEELTNLTKPQHLCKDTQKP